MALDVNGQGIGGQAFAWSSDAANVASVGPQGAVRALAGGEAHRRCGRSTHGRPDRSGGRGRRPRAIESPFLMSVVVGLRVRASRSIRGRVGASRGRNGWGRTARPRWTARRRCQPLDSHRRVRADHARRRCHQSRRPAQPRRPCDARSISRARLAFRRRSTSATSGRRATDSSLSSGACQMSSRLIC